MRIRHLMAAALAVVGFGVPATAIAAPVLMISVDGLRPGEVNEAEARGLKIPNLRQLAATGIVAKGVRPTLPTVTYPNHTTLVTGVAARAHGIAANVVFDPLRKKEGDWFWFADDVKVPELWDAAAAIGKTSASFGWPVTVGQKSITYNVPEFWRNRTPDDLKLLRAVTTPGLAAEIDAHSGVKFADLFQEDGLKADEARAKATAAIIASKKPALTTLHLTDLDHQEHGFGPGSPEANATLEKLDAIIGDLVRAARAAEPDLVVAIVSDHGFAPVTKSVNLAAAFTAAGLIRTDAQGNVVDWDAFPWISGGSAAIMLQHPNDEAVKTKVKAVLDALAADPANGIDRIADARGIEAFGGQKDAVFWVSLKPGFTVGGRTKGDVVSGANVKGMHGYFPDLPEMRSTLILNGKSVPNKGVIADIDMRDIAPTVAKIIGATLPIAEGRPIY